MISVESSLPSLVLWLARLLSAHVQFYPVKYWMQPLRPLGKLSDMGMDDVKEPRSQAFMKRVSA